MVMILVVSLAHRKGAKALQYLRVKLSAVKSRFHPNNLRYYSSREKVGTPGRGSAGHRGVPLNASHAVTREAGRLWCLWCSSKQGKTCIGTEVH